jgi:hypothetical protein
MQAGSLAFVDNQRVQAGEQFRRLHGRAMVGHLWAKLTRRTQHLLNLNEVEQSQARHMRTHAGLRQVPIAQTRGSEGRCHDFDTEFRPLQGHTIIYV